MRHYYVLSQSPCFVDVFAFIRIHNLDFSAHLNRTRFWVPDGIILTEFLLRFSECVSIVDDTVDLATGLRVPV
jgi:hypothetical protein